MKTKPSPHAARARQIVAFARERGLLGGPKTRIIRGRMDPALVERAKRRTGIASDTELIEAALATLVLEDDFGAWLVSQRGTVDSSLDLDF